MSSPGPRSAASLTVTIACEGPTDAAVLIRLLSWLDIEAAAQPYIQGGKGKLDKKLRAYNEAARYAPWLIVRDLDSDSRCAPEVARSLIPEPSAKMCFRLAVRQIEAWLLADRVGTAEFLSINANLIPTSPDSLANAKAELIRLAGRGRSRNVRTALLPVAGSTQQVGQEHTARLVEFASRIWDPGRAIEVSPSLASCSAALHRLKLS
jgi:hypothetical protein